MTCVAVICIRTQNDFRCWQGFGAGALALDHHEKKPHNPYYTNYRLTRKMWKKYIHNNNPLGESRCPLIQPNFFPYPMAIDGASCITIFFFYFFILIFHRQLEREKKMHNPIVSYVEAHGILALLYFCSFCIIGRPSSCQVDVWAHSDTDQCMYFSDYPFLHKLCEWTIVSRSTCQILIKARIQV